MSTIKLLFYIKVTEIKLHHVLNVKQSTWCNLQAVITGDVSTADSTAEYTAIPIPQTALWYQYCRLNRDTSTADWSVIPVPKAVPWYKYGRLYRNTGTTDCTVIPQASVVYAVLLPTRDMSIAACCGFCACCDLLESCWLLLPCLAPPWLPACWPLWPLVDTALPTTARLWWPWPPRCRPVLLVPRHFLTATTTATTTATATQAAIRPYSPGVRMSSSASSASDAVVNAATIRAVQTPSESSGIF